MTRWTEGVLSLTLTVLLGVVFWLFTGQPLGLAGTNQQTPVVADAAAIGRGKLLVEDAGCQACHTADGTPAVGPTWKGLAGSSRPLESGETVVADDAYLRQSILDPLAQVVAGFAPVMPATYSKQLSSDDIDDLIAYIKSLAS